MWRGGAPMRCAELEFLAEDELVRVLPTFEHPALPLIAGEVGPFRPNILAEVPLWVALRLRESNMCTVQCPAWMTVDALTATLKSERDNAGQLAALPFHYLEIATLLLQGSARMDIPKPDTCEELLHDIEKAREGKFRSGIANIMGLTATDALPQSVDLTRASAMEVNNLRHGFATALDEIVEMGDAQLRKDMERRARDAGRTRVRASVSSSSAAAASSGGMPGESTATATARARPTFRANIGGAIRRTAASSETPAAGPDDTEDVSRSAVVEQQQGDSEAAPAEEPLEPAGDDAGDTEPAPAAGSRLRRHRQ